MYSVTALMPMKGHSERVPDKNIANFCGRPLYTWVMGSLLMSPRVSRIIIDTDSERIKRDIADRYGEEKRILVIDRPKRLLGDFISVTELIRYDMSFADGEDILQTHATCPLLTTETINSAIDKYFENKANGTHDSLLTATRIQSRLYFASGAPINHKTNVYKRSQDETPVYEENSNIFLFSKTSLEDNNGRIGKRPYFYEMDKLESTDINEKQDLYIAEALLRLRREER